MFDDFALADYNNNLAATQFKVEVISSGSTARNAIAAGDVTITSDAPAVVYRYNDGVINAVRMGRYWGRQDLQRATIARHTGLEWTSPYRLFYADISPVTAWGPARAKSCNGTP